nr:MAG: capsid protein [Cressdnaviricota sp.]
MAPLKKTSYKKAYKKRTSYKKKKTPSVKTLAKKVHKLQKEQELKHTTAVFNSYDNSTFTTGLVFTNPQTLLLNGMQRGTSYTTRVGDTVRATSIDVRGQIYFTSVTTRGGFDVDVRLMLIQMKKPEGLNMLLYSYNPITAGRTPYFCKSAVAKYPNTWEQMDPGVLSNPYFQYKTLYDKVHRLKNHVAWYDGTNPQCINPFFNFHIKRKLSSITDYSRSNNGDITDIETNAYYFVAITDTTSAITIAMNSCFYFKDA